MLCRNLRSSGVSRVRSAVDCGVSDGSSMKQSRQQSDRAFTMDTFLRHRGQRHSITSLCVDERPTPDICLGTPPHLQVNGNLRYRSEEHTSELQSPCNLVCRLLLEKK